VNSTAKLLGVLVEESNWRPFEPSREAVAEAQRARDENTCNRHDDCEAATLAYMQRHEIKHRWQVPFRLHCHDENCEECFGC